MSDSSDGEFYSSLPYEQMSVTEVWQDDGSDDVFLRRKESLPEYNMNIMTTSVLKACDDQVRRIVAMLPPENVPGQLGSSAPTCVVRPSTPTINEPPGENLLDIVVQQPRTEQAEAVAGSSGTHTRVQPISERHLQFRRQLSIRGDDVEFDDDYDVLTLAPDERMEADEESIFIDDSSNI